MMSVRPQLEHNGWVQSRVDAVAPQHGQLITNDAVNILIATRDSGINSNNGAPAVPTRLSLHRRNHYTPEDLCGALSTRLTQTSATAGIETFLATTAAICIRN